MPHLICYDITQDSLRTRLAKKISESGLDRINKSVYLGSITDTALNALEKDLAKFVQEKGSPGDSLIILPVYLEQINQMRIYGSIEPDRDELSGSKSTLIV
ncbi:CRISPR-associated endonuclease Cas2 [Haliscomenobacter hydrossis]|uniref:CRISPR-associated endoribonuclease Cas2 n=1 Tax=Haliscomenobacter hydrossis (strain ATCC 27775 / DSM 1100 / LMG 10767 / O) TaxID=760192 RepID=F4L2L5_HALH1|nr:CRISPR-associated endonuclease Cas2 [Haliscomenobacter hydrossis]AEE53933.1 CRISPR-associated protein Cas2 [Haliscomenobacter hydrossis DSM 1100]